MPADACGDRTKGMTRIGMTRILVTVVRGKTGVASAELLVARRGVEVRGGSSDPAAVSMDVDAGDVVRLARTLQYFLAG